MKYKRIDKIISYVEPNQYTLDIGTDHALVPIFLYKKGITKNILAVDSNENPLQNGTENLKENNLEDKIKIEKSDGFKSVEGIDKFEAVIIAGIGGKNIATILEETKSRSDKLKAKLILNPTNNSEILRKTLMKMHYKIIDEEIVYENGMYAKIIVAEYSNFIKSFMTNKSLFIGPVFKTKYFEDSDVRTYFTERKDYYEDVYQKSKKREFLKKFKYIKALEYKYKKRLNNK